MYSNYDESCVLKHPHQGKHLSSKTVIRRMKDPKWKNRCVICGKETNNRNPEPELDLYVCGSCFFEKDFRIGKEIKKAEMVMCRKEEKII